MSLHLACLPHMCLSSCILCCSWMASQPTEAGPPRKKRKVRGHCHFKSAWKDQVFTVTVGGAKKTFSGKVLSGLDGADNMTYSVWCNLLYLSHLLCCCLSHPAGQVPTRQVTNLDSLWLYVLKTDILGTHVL
jgi:hypothetical protein